MKTYYCSICKKTITVGELRYSIDKYGRPLCRDHQKLEIQKTDISKSEVGFESQDIYVHSSNTSTENNLLKRIALSAGKSIRKGTVAIADATKNKIDTNTGKEDILRRMYPNKLKQLAREKGVILTNHSFEEIISTLKRNVSYDDLVDFAERNYISVSDITNNIDQKKTQRELKRMNQAELDENLFLQIKKAIVEFKPLMPEYPNELPYHIDLARYLKNIFDNTKVEYQKGASRPDIVIDNIAIEIKGPTNGDALRTIADKCIRYPTHFNQGFFIVLFKVNDVTTRFYEEWKNNLMNHFPNVEILKKA